MHYNDFSVGTWMVMLKISMRHLMVCQCIMAVICMIGRIQIGTTLWLMALFRTVMVHHHSRFLESSDVRQDCQMDVAPVIRLHHMPRRMSGMRVIMIH